MHYLPDYWIDPERLWPERWEEGEGKGQAAHGLPINHSAYAPSGVGQRACFGSRLAILELKVGHCIRLRVRFAACGQCKGHGRPRPQRHGVMRRCCCVSWCVPSTFCQLETQRWTTTTA